MSKNKTLSDAKSAKNDEFYTQYADIQKEVNAYLDYDPTGSFSVTLSVVGPDIATSVSCGVTSTATETVLLTAPEAALKAIDVIGNDYNGTIQKVNMEFEADGQFK